ncbi:MAG: polymer-forming cytoskeletal protein, partial [candidate division Zixibacteria bacterium]
MRISLLEKAGLIAAFLFFVLTGDSALAQQESAGDASADTVFQEIKLSDEGVTAVDTAGNDWYYDFTVGTFVTGVLRDGSEQRGPEGREDTGDYPAIEVRCTEEISFKPLVSSALVGYDEFVDDDIIAYGRVTIKGWVKGDVTSIGKRVLVASSGRVDGDIAAPEIIVKEGGIVRGEQIIADEVWLTGGGF